jgi:hypothetical protein
VFEKRVLGRTFGPRRNEEISGWRKLHNEELHNVYCLPSIITIIKSRRMRWAGNVAQIGEKRNAYRILVGKPEGKNHYEDLDVGGSIILRWILKRQDRDQWIALVNTVMNLKVRIL